MVERSAVAVLPDALRPWVCRACLGRMTGGVSSYIICQFCGAGLGLYSAMSHVTRCPRRPAALTSAESPLPLVIRIQIARRPPMRQRVKVECYEIQGAA